MRKAQHEALHSVQIRIGLNDMQMRDLSMLLASTCGPLIIGSLIEKGLSDFRKAKVKPAHKNKRR